jgi:hypothetical protein
VPVLCLVPDDPATNPKEGVVGPDTLAAVRQIPLRRLL